MAFESIERMQACADVEVSEYDWSNAVSELTAAANEMATVD